MSKEKSILVADYQNRVIWFDGSITQKTARRFSKILAKLNKLKKDPIVFYIRGLGGNPWATFSMINDIHNSPSPVGCVAHGHVASGCFTLTQPGTWRAALPGTKFFFHSAVTVSYPSKKNRELTQSELNTCLDKLRLADWIQFFWFSMRGRPVEMIQDMLKSNKSLSLPKAKKFKLMDISFKKSDFLKDRKSIRKILRKQK